ncbi:DUF4296 domain-containing protein [Tamlana sp. I1]|uniref:DUF4296 domain-containing protein n=1 Tax=Tamlana sp. I1 TaxID=2762061 RepID=UPI00188DC9C8|nr:DUF4296 domain-containing protein [Tamlana sp. I1]
MACNRFNGPDKPDNLISKDKMVDIMIDTKILISSNSTDKRVMRDSNLDMDTYIFKKYNIDSLQFALSNAYYAFHIEDYEEIYTKAIDSLEKLNIELKAIQAEEWKAQTKKEEEALLKSKSSEKELDSLTPAVRKDSIRNANAKKDLESKKSLLTPN